MDELIDLAILRRNARFRAWSGHGVPVRGLWRRELSSGPAWPVRLDISCTACMEARYDIYKAGHLLEEPWASEARVIAWFRGCVHLPVLLRDEPREVKALWELELLAG